jgi:hypothetical protein
LHLSSSMVANGVGFGWGEGFARCFCISGYVLCLDNLFIFMHMRFLSGSRFSDPLPLSFHSLVTCESLDISFVECGIPSCHVYCFSILIKSP